MPRRLEVPIQVKWDGYDDLTWEDRATLDEDAAKEDSTVPPTRRRRLRYGTGVL
jgi:hypothetical protein